MLVVIDAQMKTFFYIWSQIVPLQVFGYSLALFCLTIQSCVGIMCKKYDDKKVLIFDVFTMVTLLSAINVWRGVWSFVSYFTGKKRASLGDSRIIPCTLLSDGNKKWILILNTLAWVLLMIVNCSFSLSAKDILKDAENQENVALNFRRIISLKYCLRKVTKNVTKATAYELDCRIYESN